MTGVGASPATFKMLPFWWVYVLLLLSCLLPAQGKWQYRQRYATAAAAVAKYRVMSVTVDPSGHGNFTIIQKAIDSVPENNEQWFIINIKTGIYREKIKIPYDKPYIILSGEGKRLTRVVWDDHDSLAQSPTFSSLADNIVVRSMSFTNTYNRPLDGKNKNPRVPAVAAMIAGDKSAFYDVGFAGLQDTLWDCEGRHYFYRCTIQGAVDFIFGSGQSIYDGCAIQVLGEELEPGLAGYITAQGRTDPGDANGFVFKNCIVFGTGSAFLGRPWRGYSRVVFYNTNLTAVVAPKGWDAWNFVGHEYQLMYAEYACYGPGANTSERVKWEKKLSSDDANRLAGLSFINREGWLNNLP